MLLLTCPRPGGLPTGGGLDDAGLTLHDLGRWEEALAHYEAALRSEPAAAHLHNNIGVCVHEAGRPEEAVPHYERALAIDPYFLQAHHNLGVALCSVARYQQGIVHHQTAIRLLPDDVVCYQALAESLAPLTLSAIGPELRKDLLTALSLDGLDHQPLAFPILCAVKESPDFRRLLDLVRSSQVPGFDDLAGAGLSALIEDDLFTALLGKAILRDAEVEVVLTAARRSFLALAVGGGFPRGRRDIERSFVFALARQCFTNEYVYSVSRAEWAMLAQARSRLAEWPPGAEDGRFTALAAVYACYEPLSDVLTGRITDGWAPAELRGLVEQQIHDPALEARLAESISSTTLPATNADPVSCRVRAQYESNPYPRWLGGGVLQSLAFHRAVRRRLPHVPAERIPEIRYPDILVAGCGTGQQVVDRAVGVQGASVLGVDLSVASLAYAKRKVLESGARAEVRHADILDLGSLGESFDFIECIGVLHHVDDLGRAWGALAACLRPGGLMRVGLYSDDARRDIAAAQSLVARRGYPATADGIRRCRSDFLLSPDDEIARTITKVVDFYTLSETRDLLFHEHERRFSLPRIAEIISAAGMDFVGLEVPDAETMKTYLSLFPEDSHATSLSNWHAYEQDHPDTFIGLYVLWVGKSAISGG